MDHDRNESSYRKGLLLGLTMAEIAFLLIFILLLLITSTLFDRQARATKDGKPPPLIELLNTELGRTGPVPLSKPIDSVIHILEEGVGGRCLSKDEQDALKRLLIRHRNELAEFARMNESVALALPKDAKRELKIDELSSEKLSSQDVSKIYEQTLGALTKCHALPPCWLAKDGTYEYLFEITMSDQGLSIHDVLYPHRTGDKKQLPLQRIKYGTTYSVSNFLKDAAPLLEYAANQKQCRHAVHLKDDTTIKATFKPQYFKLHQKFWIAEK